jgi:hypothetical protein
VIRRIWWSLWTTTSKLAVQEPSAPEEDLDAGDPIRWITSVT